MKKLTGIITIICLLGISSLQAQVVKKAGDKTAEVASKTKSAVVDNRYKDKVGPHGEAVYIDHKSKYYYVNKKGHKVYISKMQMHDKKD